MGNNVLINGRSAVHAGSNGTLNTIDVCLTPQGNGTAPIPYPNVARSADTDKGADSVLINGNPACHIKSVFKKSTGDQPGKKKGVVSGTIKGEASFVSSAFDVLIEGQAAVRAMDLMVSNKKNTPPAPLMQPIGMPPLPTRTEAPKEAEAHWQDKVGVYVQGQAGQTLAGLGAEDDI